MNRKFRFLAILMMLLAAFVFTGCDGNAADGLFDGDNGGDGPTPPTTVAVESVSLDKAALVLKTGTYGTLTATVLPENATDKSVTWSSDNEAVATVDNNGNVTGVAAGPATITVTTTDGAKTATCVVTVEDEVYTVSFNMKEHGTQLDNQTVAKNGKIVKPTDPEAEGFNFKYWYKDEETVEWDFDTEVTADMTLNAKWVAVYRVSFAAGDGSGAMDPSEPLEAGTSYTIPANGFTAPKIPVGAVNGDADIPFAGWNTKADGSGTAYAAGAVIPADDLTDDMTLYAQWAKPVFTVGKGNDNTAGTDDDEKVYFAKGNLQAVFSSAGSTKTWKFAENQYDYVGGVAANTKINGNGSVSEAGTVDLFGWSTSATNYGINQSEDNSTYSGDFKDWGKNAITNGGNTADTWRTLTNNEWSYLLNTRDNASNLKKYGVTVCTKTNCLIIAPDNFSGTIETSYDATAWSAAEAAGLVCLPAAGNRDGSSVSDVDNVGDYWSATTSGSNSAYKLVFLGSSVNPAGNGRRLSGRSVRLVWDE